MIELSFAKLVVLALIALIVLGPEKLPVVARTAGALIRRVRGGWDTVRAEVERELEVEEIRRVARELVEKKDAVQSGLNASLKQVENAASAIAAGSPAVKPAASTPAPGLTQDDTVPEAAVDGPATAVAATDAGAGDLFANAEAAPDLAEAQKAQSSAAAEPPHGSA